MRQYKPFPTYPLPPRFQRVLEQVLLGKQQKELPDILNISLHTARSYIRTMYGRLGVHNRMELANKIATMRGTSAPVPVIYSGQEASCES